MRYITFIDTETTGLRPWDGDEMIQFAAVTCSLPYLEYLDDLEVKIQFRDKNQEGLRFSSYARETWAQEAIPRLNACRKIADYLDNYRDMPVVSAKTNKEYFVARVAGHNVSFDMRFIKDAFRSESVFLPAAYTALDTLQLAAWWQIIMQKDLGNLKLETLAKHFELGSQTHDAYDDVVMTIEVAQRMLREITNETGSGQALCFDGLPGSVREEQDSGLPELREPRVDPDRQDSQPQGDSDDDIPF